VSIDTSDKSFEKENILADYRFSLLYCQRPNKLDKKIRTALWKKAAQDEIKEGV